MVTPLGNGHEGYGSGVLVAVDDRWGYVLTAYHVVEQRQGGPVCWFGDRWAGRAAVIGGDQAHDVAVLQIAKPPSKPLVVQSASQPLKPGDQVWLVGFARGIHYEESPGRVTGVIKIGQGAEWMDTSASTTEGVSGGPILDARRQVVGLVSSRVDTLAARSAGCGPFAKVLRLVLGRCKPRQRGKICLPRRPQEIPVPPPIADQTAPPLPSTVGRNEDAECRAQLAALIKSQVDSQQRIDQLTALVADLAKQSAIPGKDGIDGAPGKDGKDGAPGKDGKDATVDYDRVREIVKEEIQKQPNQAATTQAPVYWDLIRRK